MWTVSATTADGLVRAGTLVARHTNMATPAPLLYTRRGCGMFLSPDMMEKLKPQAQMLQINVMQFMSQPDAELLRQFGASLHHYLGVPGWGLLAVNRDASLAEYAGKPATDKHVNAINHSGSHKVTPERYMDTIAAIQPEVYVALADEIPAGTRRKKVVASTDRTLKWLEECLQRHEQLQQAAGGSSNAGAAAEPAAPAAGPGAASAAPPPRILAPVVGCDLADERERSARGAAQLPVDGFALCGFGMGETYEQQAELLQAAVAHLPAGKPRLVLGLGSPDEVVQAVGLGIDVFDCTYVQHATAGGYALNFRLSPEHEAERPADGVDAPAGGGAATAPAAGGGEPAAKKQRVDSGEGPLAGAAPRGRDGDELSRAAEAASRGSDGNKLNLWSLAYREDARPLVPGCTCFACSTHNRAYVHHLLHTHEILGSVLLELHNTHWWLAFAGAMRGAIADGRWAAYAAWWQARRAARAAAE